MHKDAPGQDAKGHLQMSKPKTLCRFFPNQNAFRDEDKNTSLGPKVILTIHHGDARSPRDDDVTGGPRPHVKPKEAINSDEHKQRNAFPVELYLFGAIVADTAARLAPTRRTSTNLQYSLRIQGTHYERGRGRLEQISQFLLDCL